MTKLSYEVHEYKHSIVKAYAVFMVDDKCACCDTVLDREVSFRVFLKFWLKLKLRRFKS